MRDKFSAVFHWQIKTCRLPIVNHNDKNLVQGVDSLKFSKKSVLFSLLFIVLRAIYVNRVLQSFGSDEDFTITWRNDEDLFNDYSSKAFKAGFTVKKKFLESVDSSASPEKRILLDKSVSCSPNSLTSPLISTPAKTARPVTEQFPFLPLDRWFWSDQTEKIVVKLWLKLKCNGLATKM